eukprot:539118-Alexandrium_andersonii.AAC.1
MDQHLLALLEDAHRDTWFGITGCERVGRTLRGSRQGDPLGDALYNLVAARLSALVRQRLGQQGHEVKVPWDSQASVLAPVLCPTEVQTSTDVSYIDDTAITFEASSCARLIETAQEVAGTVLDIFSEYG